MNKTTIIASAATLLASALVVAPSAAAAPEQWEMPDLKGISAAAAEQTFTDATVGSGLSLSYYNRTGVGEVINLSNWTVCYQNPKAGTALTAKSYVGLSVNRPNQC